MAKAVAIAFSAAFRWGSASSARSSTMMKFATFSFFAAKVAKIGCFSLHRLRHGLAGFRPPDDRAVFHPAVAGSGPLRRGAKGRSRGVVARNPTGFHLRATAGDSVLVAGHRLLIRSALPAASALRAAENPGDGGLTSRGQRPDSCDGSGRAKACRHSTSLGSQTSDIRSEPAAEAQDPGGSVGRLGGA